MDLVQSVTFYTGTLSAAPHSSYTQVQEGWGRVINIFPYCSNAGKEESPWNKSIALKINKTTKKYRHALVPLFTPRINHPLPLNISLPLPSPVKFVTGSSRSLGFGFHVYNFRELICMWYTSWQSGAFICDCLHISNFLILSCINSSLCSKMDRLQVVCMLLWFVCTALGKHEEFKVSSAEMANTINTLNVG